MILRSTLTTLALWITTSAAYTQEVQYYTDCLQYLRNGETLYDQKLYGQSRVAISAFLTSTECQDQQIHEPRAKSTYLKAGLQMDIPQAIHEATQYIDLQYPNPYIHDLVVATADYYYQNNQYGEAISYYDKVDLDRIPQNQMTTVSLRKGYAHFVLREFKEAAYTLSYARNIRGANYDRINYYYGMACYFMDDYEATIKAFRRVESSPAYGSYIPYYVCQIYYKEKKYDKLITYGENAVKSNTVQNTKEIRQLLGQIYFKEGDYQKALPHLEMYESKTQSLTEEEFYQLAFTQYQLKEYSKAKSNFLELSGLQTRLGQVANYYLADCLEKLGDKQSARAAFKKVSQMSFSKEMQEEAAFNYGKLSIEQGHEREALNILTSIRTNSPYFKESQTLINDIVKNSSDYENSIAILDALPSLSKDLQYTYHQLAYKRAEQAFIDKDYPTSLIWLDKTVQYPMDPVTMAKTHFWRARIAGNQGQYEKSIGHFQDFFGSTSSGPELPMEVSLPIAYYYQAYNNLKLKDYKEASLGFKQSSNGLKKMIGSHQAPFLHTMYKDAVLRLADCYFKTNNYNQAIKYYDTAAKNKDASYPYARYQTSTILGLQNKSYDKIVVLEEIRDKYPASEYADNALLDLGDTYLQQGKPEPAMINYQRLVNQYSDRSPLANAAVLKMGLIKYNEGDYATALKLYKKVLKLNPSPDQSQEALRGIEEIFVNELGNTKDYIAFLDSIPNVKIDAYAQDSLLYRAAESQYTYGNYSKSIELFSDYLSENPQGAFAIPSYYTRGEAYAAKKDYVQALSDYRKVVDMGVNTYYERALYKAALISYNHTQDFAVSYNLNNTLTNYTQDDRLRKIARLYALQSAFRTSNDIGIEKHANLILTDSNTTKEDKLTARYYLGKNKYQNKKYTDAIAALKPILASEKSTNQRAEAAYLLAKIAYDRGQYSDAETLANTANKLNSQYPSWIAKGLLLLSDIYIKKDNLLNARAAIEAVIDNFTTEADIIKDAKQKLALLESIEERNNRIKSSNSKTLELQKNGN